MPADSGGARREEERVAWAGELAQVGGAELRVEDDFLITQRTLRKGGGGGGLGLVGEDRQSGKQTKRRVGEREWWEGELAQLGGATLRVQDNLLIVAGSLKKGNGKG